MIIRKKRGRPVGSWKNKYRTKVQMEPLINAYFSDCEKNKTPLTITGLALALDLTTAELAVYETKIQFTSTIKKAKERVINSVEKQVLSSTHPVGAIFWLKAIAKWRDSITITGEDGQPIEISITSFKNTK